ncbi:MAG: TIR domain-containing protein [Azoarcus sp.]|jgi:Tol biopolymer transport system component/ABC-type dipeptide/oligopeptide/nickel transport system ATPase subunit|nr:TIR domain-containing protein [Azoarcus sp.]
MTEKTKTFDAFLSYNSKEKHAIQALDSKLQACGIDCFLDNRELNLEQDSPVTPPLIDAIECSSRVFVAIIGPALAGPWQAREIAKALKMRADEVHLRDRIILVCLPALAKEKRESLRDALELNSAIVFERHLDERTPFTQLLNAIKGKIRQTQPDRTFPDETSWIKENPYKGLAFFQEKDHDKFFGRKELTRDLIGRIQTALDKGAPRLLILSGASGCGKSSLARAGIVAGLKNGGITGSEAWAYATLIPNDRPLDSLANAVVGGLAQNPADAVKLTVAIENDLRDGDEKTLNRYLLQAGEGKKFVVLVDQFEETFTLCRDDGIRRAFIDNLLFAASQHNGPGIVILTVRSDFYQFLIDACGIARPEYVGCLRPIGSVEENELRAAIVEPAQAASVEFAPELLDRMREETEPRDLPLLQDILFKLWPYRVRGTIPLDAYKAIGGVRGALAQRADAIHHSFSPDEQTIVRHIFLRLLRINEDALVTRQRMARANLAREGEKERVEAIVDRLVKERLLVTDAGKVEIIHEALVKNWPALEGWLEEGRGNLYSRQRIEDDARRWEWAGRDDADVYSGNRLASALDWQDWDAWAASPLGLSESAGEFLRAGGEKAQAAERQNRLFEVRRIMLEAQVMRDEQFDLSLLLSATLGQDHPDVAESLGALLSTTQSHPKLAAFLQGHTGSVTHLAFSRDGHTLASASGDKTVILWDVRDPRAPRKIQALQGHTDEVNHLAFSPDGHTLASASDDNTVILWDVRDPRAPRKIQALQGHTNLVWHLAFSPDGHTLASASADKTVILWDVRDPQAPRKIQVLQDHTDEVNYLAFSPDPDGHTLASASDDGTVILWDVRDPQAPRKIQALQGHTGKVNHLAFSPDGHTLASASWDETVILWDVRDPQAPRKIQALQGHTDQVQHLAFSPDGHTLASASADKNILLWDTDPASLARKACRIAGRNMTRDEWRRYMGDKPYRKICEQFPEPGET